MLLPKFQFGLTSATLMQASPAGGRCAARRCRIASARAELPSSKPMRACQPVASVSAVVSETYQS